MTTPQSKPVPHPSEKRGRMSDRFAATDKPRSARITIKRLWTYFKSERKPLVLLFIGVMLQVVATLIAPYVIGLIVDDIHLQVKRALPQINLLLMGLLVVTYLVTSMALLIQGRVIAGISQNIMYHMRHDLMKKLSTLPIAYYDTHGHGDMMSRFTNDVDSVSTTISESLAELMSAGLIVTGALVMMTTLSWQLTLVTLAVTPLIYLLSKMIAKFSRPLFKKRAVSLGQISSHIEESMVGLSVIQAFNQEAATLNQFKSVNHQLKTHGMQAQMAVGFLMPMMNVINNLSFALSAFVGGVLIIQGLITIGVVMAFIAYSRQFIRPINQIASVYSSLQSALASSERIFEFLDEKPEQAFGTLPFSQLKDTRIEFSDVTFGYDPNHPILTRVNLTVEPGKKIALVGPTGAGKTTLVNLLARFYSPQNGVITIGGTPINALDTPSFYKAFGIVLQDPYLFSGTIKDNITYGNTHVSDEDIKRALVASAAHGFVNKLPLGLNTPISEGGTNLSQGQRQLITIARAIINNPSILILDEATSSVDTRTEHLIQEAMVALMKDRTSFIIAHRLSTIRDADHILVIDKGCILEEGTHQDLMALRGHYYTMIKHQYKNEAIETPGA